MKSDPSLEQISEASTAIFSAPLAPVASGAVDLRPDVARDVAGLPLLFCAVSIRPG